MLLLSTLVRKVVQSAVVCWLVKSHYTERQIGSISLPPYANPACWPQARTSGMSKTLHFESRVPYYRPDRTDYFGGSCILRRDRQL